MISPLTQLCALSLRPSTHVLDHTRCSRFVCEANQVTAQYDPKHTDDCSRSACNFIPSQIGEVTRILEEDSLPLIEISRKLDGPPELRVVRNRPGRRFVAISHVWSDGMGNKTKNAMRTCQLIRIWEKVKSLVRDNSQIVLSSDNEVNLFVLGFAYLSHSTRNLLDVDKDTVTIWMDTLCVPLKTRKTRDLAIKSMRSAYEKGMYSIPRHLF